MMYSIMALDVLGLRAGRSAPRGGPAPVRQPDGGRWRALLLPAVFFAGMGYGDRRLRAGRRATRSHPRPGAGGRLAADARRSAAKAIGPSSAPIPSLRAGRSSINNEFYPDIDDTAMVMLALSAGAGHRPAAQKACRQAGARLAAGDAVEATAAGRRSTPTTTGNSSATSRSPTTTPCSIPPVRISPGRVLEGSGGARLGPQPSGRAARRGVAGRATSSRTEAGTAAGAWRTFTAPVSRCAAWPRRARDDREAHILRGGEWLRSIQNADGGWGESCASYDNGVFTAGPSTPSQTAWAIMGLIAGGDADSLSVQHGIE